jgi:enamine deaminase RidA (YjgF/YER057c/UK114 family)
MTGRVINTVAISLSFLLAAAATAEPAPAQTTAPGPAAAPAPADAPPVHPAWRPSPGGVKTLMPKGGIRPTGTWSLGTRSGDFVSVAGMRGIDPKTNRIVEDPEARIRQAFRNMELVAQSEGASLRDAARLVVFVTDMFRYRPIVNKVQEEMWGKGPYPPRTIIEVDRLNDDDIAEIEGTFYAPQASPRNGAAATASQPSVKTLAPEGGIKTTGTWDLGTRAGDFVFVAGMRGIDPKTNTIIPDPEARITQAFRNMELIAKSEGAGLRDAVRLVVYTTDMFRYRPIVNKVQEELWGKGPYPPRTIVQVDRLNQDDMVEVEGTFYAPSTPRLTPVSGQTSPNGVKTLTPAGGIKTTGTWDLGTAAGDFVFVAGMRGIDPKSNTIIADPKSRVRQAFRNMELIAKSEGASLRDAARLVVYVTDMYRYRPIVNEVQGEFWGKGPYPPRTIVEVDRLNQDDIVEVEGTFYRRVTR